MPPIQKRFPSQKIRKRRGRGRIYLILAALLIIAITVGVYVFEFQGSPNNGDFKISLPLGITILTNQTSTQAITITTTNGFRGTVKLTAITPNNVTATVNPANVTGAGTATLSMTAKYPGNYTIRVTGTSGTLEHSVSPVVATPLYATLLVNGGSSNGTIEVELYRAQTPKTVSNFVTLAQSGFYNQLVWHRIATSPYVIQTGDPNTRNGGGNRTYVAGECCYWGAGGSSTTIPFESPSSSSLSNTAGTVAMARGNDLNSASSQFYINVGDNTSLDTANGGYAVFGKVINNGLTVVRAISSHPVTGEQPLDPLPFLITVTISNTPRCC